jgi:hypothetical protein
VYFLISAMSHRGPVCLGIAKQNAWQTVDGIETILGRRNKCRFGVGEQGQFAEGNYLQVGSARRKLP